MIAKRCRLNARVASGFTLLELLVAMAVLMLLVVVLASIVGSVSNVWTRSRGEIDNFSEARPLIQTIKRDLHTIVLRQDLPAFPDSQFAFYTRQFRQTNSSLNPRGLSYVFYSFDSSSRILNCQSQPLDFNASLAWTNTAPSITTPSAALGSGVYAFSYNFIGSDGNTTPTFSNPVVNATNTVPYPTRAVRISLAILDPQADKVLEKLGWQADLQSDLAAETNAASPKKAWEQMMSVSGWGSHHYPAAVLTGLATYEYVVPLDSSSPYVDFASAP